LFAYLFYFEFLQILINDLIPKPSLILFKTVHLEKLTTPKISTLKIKDWREITKFKIIIRMAINTNKTQSEESV
jgi:hypothetical protein